MSIIRLLSLSFLVLASTAIVSASPLTFSYLISGSLTQPGTYVVDAGAFAQAIASSTPESVPITFWTEATVGGIPFAGPADPGSVLTFPSGVSGPFNFHVTGGGFIINFFGI